MKFIVGGKIISKKPHACGCNQWVVERVGADVKLRCVKCGKAMFVLIDQAEKMTKKYIDGEIDER